METDGTVPVVSPPWFPMVSNGIMIGDMRHIISIIFHQVEIAMMSWNMQYINNNRKSC